MEGGKAGGKLAPTLLVVLTHPIPQRSQLASEIERLTNVVDTQREELSNASAGHNRLSAHVESLQAELEWRQSSTKAREVSGHPSAQMCTSRQRDAVSAATTLPGGA